MSSPTSTKTSWLKEKLTRRISGSSDLSVTNSAVIESVSIEEYTKTRLQSTSEVNTTTEQDPFDEPRDWEVLTLVKSTRQHSSMDQTDGSVFGGHSSPSGRKTSGQAKALASPILGGRYSVAGVNRSSTRQDKKTSLDTDRPASAGAVVHRNTSSKKKLLSVNSTSGSSARSPSPGLERSPSQKNRSREGHKLSSPGLRDSSPVNGDQAGSFSKVRDTLRIRKVKKKGKPTKAAAYSVPVLDIPNKYQDPFEPEFNMHDDKTAEEGGTGHEFSFIINVPHYQPQYCDYCQQVAWGHHQVLKCSKCEFICHKKCESRIFMKCSSKVESEALLQQDRTKEAAFDDSLEVNDKNMTDRPAGASASPSTGTHPLSEKALLAKKIREYNRRTTPVHQIHIKHRDVPFDYQAFVRVHMCIQRPIHVSTGVTRTSWYRLMRPVKEKSIDSGIDAGLETAFYLPTDTNRLVHISNLTTTKDLISTLLKKFCITDNPKKFSLYEEYGSDSRRLFDEDHPLQEVLEASIVGRNSKLALRDNLCSTIQWDAFSLPELQNFITILAREETLYAERLKDCFLNWKKHLHDELIDKRGSDPHRSISAPSSHGSGSHTSERRTSDPAINGDPTHPLAASRHARPMKV